MTDVVVNVFVAGNTFPINETIGLDRKSVV